MTLVSPTEFIANPILPTRLVHLLAGASGSSKTTYLFQNLPKYERGEAWDGGFQTKPGKYLYIACDRPLREADDTLRRIGIDPDTVTRFSLVDEKNKHFRQNYKALFAHVVQNYPDIQLLVIDAIYVLTPSGKYSDNASVNDFLTEMAILCDKHGLTIIGTTHSPKMKEGDTYLQARECILGAIGWGGFASTVMYIHSTEPEDPTCPERELIVLTRNGAPHVFNYILDNRGCLVPQAPKPKENPMAKIREFLDTVDFDTDFTTQEMRDAAECSSQYVRRLLKELITEGSVRRVNKGTYRRLCSPEEAIFRQNRVQ